MLKEKFQRLKGKVGSNTIEDLSFYLCKTFHWDYYTLQRQPIPFIITLLNCLKKEAEMQKRKGK